MRHNSVARFTATALIVAAVILFILSFIPVIAVAVGGLGAGWGPGSRLWVVGPLAVGACSGALLLLAFGAILLVLTRIQDNLAVWRQRQTEAAGARAVTVSPVESAPSALATAAVASDAIAGVDTALADSEAEAAGLPAGAALAGAGVVAAVTAVTASDGEAEAATAQAEVAPPEVEVRAAGEDAGHPGLVAALAGAGIAAGVAAVAGSDEKAEPTAEEGVVAAAGAEADAREVEVGAPEEESGHPGLGVALAGAGIAAAVAAGSGSDEAEPEPIAIPESAPEPEAGAPSVEITEEEEIPPVTEEAGGLGVSAALAAAGLAAAAHEDEAGAEPEPTADEAVAPEPEASALAAGAAAAEVEAAAPAPTSPPAAWSYDEGTANVVKASGALKVEGIGEVYAGKLKEIGVTTTAALLRAGSTPKGRKQLAEQTGISPKQILKWVNRVDLARIRGISEQYADLLEAAGVDTVPELAQRNAENLLQKLVETNDAKRLVRRLPTLGMVSSWISQAKELPRVVVYH